MVGSRLFQKNIKKIFLCKCILKLVLLCSFINNINKSLKATFSTASMLISDVLVEEVSMIISIQKNFLIVFIVLITFLASSKVICWWCHTKILVLNNVEKNVQIHVLYFLVYSTLCKEFLFSIHAHIIEANFVSIQWVV